ncbi:hypothetical protein [Janthinobacterium sp. 17J80-10]|uniref:hypothetical protein n=1 Tax=Janthinobacterium sp. 17J80-10 TaxID=2497863 RepID=UPI00100535AA|nr:hypothetical protein [Janthinobacterium sp. 17J80-10]QAU34043.1 hypothetical protein EKL02_07475 [Janthinobacterium sp. 17J80-10]
MKSCSTVLVALGMLSSTALAQTTRPEPLPLPESSRMPMPGMRSDTVPATRVTPATSFPQQPAEMSSGSSANEAGASQSTGQLITPAIVQSRPNAAGDVGIKPQTKNGVRYLCGGVSEDESAYMKKIAAKDYDLMMTFAEKSGNYVADVAVAIKDARGKTLLEATCDGPIMLVDLPAAGGYRIHAETAGKAIDRTVLVKGDKGHLRQLTFAWPSTGERSATAEKRYDAGRRSAGGDADTGK